MIAYVGKEERDGPRGSPEKFERNAAIIESYQAGKTYQQIADQYGVCSARIGQILKRLGGTQHGK